MVKDAVDDCAKERAEDDRGGLGVIGGVSGNFLLAKASTATAEGGNGAEPLNFGDLGEELFLRLLLNTLRGDPSWRGRKFLVCFGWRRGS